MTPIPGFHNSGYPYTGHDRDVQVVSKGMMQYILDGEKYYHISEFSKLVGLSVQAVRHLCFKGNAIRKLEHCYDGSRVYIKATELTEFPFVKGGHASGLRLIYHYHQIEGGKWERYMCEACTYGKSLNHNENMSNLPTLE